MALLLQRVGDLARHIGLVMLGEHGIGAEPARPLEHAFGDNALPFAEEIGQQAGIADHCPGLAICHGEADALVGTTLDRTGLDQAAEAQACAGREALLDDLGRAIEEDDRIPQRIGDEAGRKTKNDAGRGDHHEATLLAGEALARRRGGDTGLDGHRDASCRPSSLRRPSRADDAD